MEINYPFNSKEPSPSHNLSLSPIKHRIRPSRRNAPAASNQAPPYPYNNVPLHKTHQEVQPATGKTLLGSLLRKEFRADDLRPCRMPVSFAWHLLRTPRT
jgi:hypothetical protein